VAQPDMISKDVVMLVRIERPNFILAPVVHENSKHQNNLMLEICDFIVPKTF
jgi:hypothetical protein